MTGDDELAAEVVGRVRAALSAAADPTRAAAMAAYMRGVAPFFGVGAPERRRLVRAALEGLPRRDVATAVGVADACWREPERELQYVGMEELGDAVGRHVRQGRDVRSALGDDDATALLRAAERLITTRPWWDTVDHLCRHVAGTVVRARPDVGRPVMDRWATAPDRWLVRSAILHQERWRGGTDADWLFEVCCRHAGDPEFFVRKAIGWALRSYAHTGPEAAATVRAFLAGPGAGLSGLSKREALRRVRD